MTEDSSRSWSAQIWPDLRSSHMVDVGQKANSRVGALTVRVSQQWTFVCLSCLVKILHLKHINFNKLCAHKLMQFAETMPPQVHSVLQLLPTSRKNRILNLGSLSLNKLNRSEKWILRQMYVVAGQTVKSANKWKYMMLWTDCEKWKSVHIYDALGTLWKVPTSVNIWCSGQTVRRETCQQINIYLNMMLLWHFIFPLAPARCCSVSLTWDFLYLCFVWLRCQPVNAQ